MLENLLSVITPFYCVDSEARYSDFVLNTGIRSRAWKRDRIKPSRDCSPHTASEASGTSLTQRSTD